MPNWLQNRTFCQIQDMMNLFEVSHATIDRWSHDVPAFSKKVKIIQNPIINAATRFMVEDVRTYMLSHMIGNAKGKD